ncbi:MAG: hypothetical protein OXM55_05365 [Bdellovibrionales bacterium]|nr:hypothetical protein [Bdellovibrionales bacterium]
MSTVKYIIYFLLSCDTKQTICFFNKYKIPVEENKSFPKSFIKNSKSFFIKNKSISCSLKKDSFLAWRAFCKAHSYEEILPIILYRILKYPKEKILWLLKIPPETLSWRFHQGLLALEKEFLNMEKEKNISNRLGDEELCPPFPIGKKSIETTKLIPASRFHEGKVSGMKPDQYKGDEGRVFLLDEGKSLGEPFKEGTKAIAYCDWLAQQALPKEVDQIATYSKSKKTKYLLFVLLCFIFFMIVIGLGVFVLSFPSKTILNMSF